ncbi:MAG: TldD/PmbA family protein [SAR324 cluster bacterium]|nr:TldD/PmbA family protein [SAR324 cluster bacterium]
MKIQNNESLKKTEEAFETVSSRLFEMLGNNECLTISIDGESSHFIRINQSKVRQVGLVDEVRCSLELKINRRQTQVVFPFTGEDATDFAKAGLELSRMREEVAQFPEDPYLVLPENHGSSREVHSGDLLPVENAVDSLLPIMQGVDLAGIWASGCIFRGTSNSAGQRNWFSTDTFSLDYSLIAPNEKMVKTIFAGTSWNQDRFEKQMRESKKQLEVMEATPKTLAPGHYRTCFAPAAVASFIEMFSWDGISEASLQQGKSALGRMRQEGEKLSPKFNLSEDFRDGTVPRFNNNGEIALEWLPLIVDGRLENTLISSRTAKEYGKESNFAANGESMRSPVMSGGDLDETKLLQTLDTGLFLSNLHYLNWSDRMGGRITGMTRYACFWVEDGKIVAPIENMRFDDSLYRIFGEHLEAVSESTQFIPEIGTYEGRQLGGIRCPSMIVDAFELTL